jgi:hypothetical protein
MRSIDKWRRLPPARRAALPEALAAVIFVRLGLWFLPWRIWERVAGRLPSAGMSVGSAETTAQDVAWAVRRVSRAVPGATCLTQALAAQFLLSRRGYASRLRIGVARAPGARLRAHAWLESDGLIVLGGAGVEAFTPLSAAAPAGEDLIVRQLSATTVNTGAAGRGASRLQGRNRHFTMGDQ